VKEKLDKPEEVKKFALTKKATNVIKQAFKKDSQPLLDFFESKDKAFLTSLKADVTKAGQKELAFKPSCDAAELTLTLKPEHVDFEERVEKTSVRSYTPGVIEPSFGIDRILFSILEHAYYKREEEKVGDKLDKAVLSLKPVIAAHQVCILPMDQRIAKNADYERFSADMRRALTLRSLSFTIDDTSATLGKRYARNDELGIPFAVTVDFDSLNDQQATIRERDSQDQIRVPLPEIPDLVQKLTHEEITWAGAEALYPTQKKD